MFANATLLVSGNGQDAQGSDNPIPLSPQWLQPKPGESKPGVGTGESSPLPAYGNHSDNTEEMHDQKKKDVFRPSLLDMETGRHDRWRDEERDTNSSLRKDRWSDGDKELGDSRRMDLWPKNSSLLRVKRLSENVVLPSRGSPLSAGYDLSSVSPAKVPARGKALIPTDLSIAIPEGTYARIGKSQPSYFNVIYARFAYGLILFLKLGLVDLAPRSGLTWKHSIDVGGGVIDADYRGPVGVILFNHSDLDFEVKVDDRIANLIIQKIVTPNVMEVEDLDATVRGAGGFGNSFRVKRLSENAVLPSRGSPLSAGYDLSSVSAAKVPARGKALIPTDLSIAIPEGTYARIGKSQPLYFNVIYARFAYGLILFLKLGFVDLAPRSGLTWKHSIDVGEGVIDADYRGPVGVILCNHSDVDFEVKVGDKIAQLIIEMIVTPNAVEVEDVDATVRGAGGCGNSFRVKRLSENAVLPSRGSPISAGCDLSSVSPAKVPARGKALIPTDLSIAIPEGTYARIGKSQPSYFNVIYARFAYGLILFLKLGLVDLAPRSGLTWKHSIDVGGGVIDADYRGPVGVILFNHSDVDFEVKVGDRIAQIIIQKIMTPNAMEVEDLDATVRGAGGFGSTGVRACFAS
ncbi:hypothetical protein DKX38_003674 [Salix brachista]|uniref:dUTP diphosphatase n=1 Tax=Salix brachista TaxID=2182728 RepID=A0A5N5NSY8_9ROSI|nr:hypothetical protein DKX38_003674 [Salix brachista]